MTNEELLYEKKDGYLLINEKTRKDIRDFSEGYKCFLNKCKTERECADWAEENAVKSGFKPLEGFERLKSGDKFYIKNKNKSILLGIMGKKPVSDGVNLVAAHIDSPRLDLKQNPLYEDNGAVFFKTHYYGGIKKYQWVTMPLAIHGVVIKKNGEKVKIAIGEKEDDPVFCVTDLLPHLAQAQMEKNAAKFIEGEKLNVIIGTVPLKDEEKNAVKINIMKILNDMYGICEKDFVSAEIEVVPSYKAQDVGFDRSLVGSYGQDDRVCAYTAFMGILCTDAPERTAICNLVDKEEIGSCDATGMQSRFFENVIAEICFKSMENYNDIAVRKALTNSKCLSADVTAAFDPNYADVCEPANSSYLNKGVALMKYSGARGKSGTSDAQAEFVQEITQNMDENEVIWQTCELGKVDGGGGGTVAQYLAMLNMLVVDCGVPIISMHSPYELASKHDIYMAYRAYNTFFRKNIK